MLEFIGAYLVIAVITLVVLTQTAGKDAQPSDLWVGALAWPITVAKLVEHIIKG